MHTGERFKKKEERSDVKHTQGFPMPFQKLKTVPALPRYDDFSAEHSKMVTTDAGAKRERAPPKVGQRVLKGFMPDSASWLK